MIIYMYKYEAYLKLHKYLYICYMFMTFFIIHLLQNFELLFFECTCTQSSTFPLEILPKEKTSFDRRLNKSEVPLL